jgi:hypothetical protein
MGRALSHPGIDPRVWASEAVVKAVNVAADGVYLDVLLIPDNVMETARWSTMYAGDGFGLYFPVRIDDTVMVVAPSGEPDYGLVAGPCWWSPAEAVPQDAINNPNDALLVMQTNRNVRFVTQGSGNLVLDPRGTGKVLLGGEASTRPVLLDVLLDQLNNHTHLNVTVGAGVSGVPASASTVPVPTTPATPNVFTDPTAPARATKANGK